MRTCPSESLKRAPAAEALTKRGDLTWGPGVRTRCQDQVSGPGVGTRRLGLPKTSPKNSSYCKKYSPAHNLAKSWGFFVLDSGDDWEVIAHG